jgi:adenylate cyclase
VDATDTPADDADRPAGATVEPGGVAESEALTTGQLAAIIMPHKRELTAGQVAEEAGVDPEFVRRLWRAMGFSNAPEGEAAYFDDDVEALERAKTLLSESDFDPDGLLMLARTIGLASARMAEAVVEYRLERTSNVEVSADRLAQLEWLLSYTVRRHMLASAVRWRSDLTARAAGAAVAVGFADLVGFTSLSEQLTERQTVELIDRFEGVATDRVVEYGGRVIKMIGDEVMFSADPAVVGELALALSESFAEPDVPSVRVGVASGPVVAQSGDLFGPVVNLASRATIAAHPGTVLISASLAVVLREDDRYRVTAIRPHRLKGLGIVPLWSLRRAGERRRPLFTKRAG